MKIKIKENIDNFEQLEILYRADKKGFEKAFFEIYPEIADRKISDFWKTRLEFDNTKEVLVKTKKTDICIEGITCRCQDLKSIFIFSSLNC